MGRVFGIAKSEGMRHTGGDIQLGNRLAMQEACLLETKAAD
jgi:hypothetical protein